ncbi:MAG TPA: hypothetical protein V6D12_16855, partial [Candidatus Obscuribacterales bacterium]
TAMSAATIAQSAESKDDWELVASRWQEAIDLMKAVPQSSKNYAVAQKKLAEYQGNLGVANKRAGIRPTKSPSPTGTATIQTSPTPSPTGTATIQISPTPSPTATPTIQASPTTSPTATPTIQTSPTR